MRFVLHKTELSQKDGVRRGELMTPHGSIKTPFFMPVGTRASVKGVSPQELRDLGAEIILSNTYHLYLRPGEKLIKQLGGLHDFMRWSGPILTDSGGYQVFSLGESKQKTKNGKSLVKITENGVEFTSHLDGSKHFFTPEKVIDIQLDLGVDILMPLDVCPSGSASADEVKQAVDLTIEWARRSKLHFDKKIAKSLNCSIVGKQKEKAKKYNNLTVKQFDNKQELPALFGIVQGGLDPELRKYCASELIKLDFDGYSIGGLAVDHETRDMWQTVELMGQLLPQNKPRYLMGVGTPDDILRAISLGMDMFDCVLPTRLARHGAVYIHKQQVKSKKSKVKSAEGEFELINLLNSKFRTDPIVIEEDCQCLACKGGFSRAYISHLMRTNEILGLRLASLHNLHTYLGLFDPYR